MVLKSFTLSALLYALCDSDHLNFAMNHVRFMISPELYVVQETLIFDITLF